MNTANRTIVRSELRGTAAATGTVAVGASAGGRATAQQPFRVTFDLVSFLGMCVIAAVAGAWIGARIAIAVGLL